MGNRERRAAKQRRRDERRGHGGAQATARTRPDRGLAPETLRALLRRAGADVAAGDRDAEAELRTVLAEHLARRRPEIVAACDEVLADTPGDAAPASGLAADLAAGGTVASWAERGRHATEDVVSATVALLAARLT